MYTYIHNIRIIRFDYVKGIHISMNAIMDCVIVKIISRMIIGLVLHMFTLHIWYKWKSSKGIIEEVIKKKEALKPVINEVLYRIKKKIYGGTVNEEQEGTKEELNEEKPKDVTTDNKQISSVLPKGQSYIPDDKALRPRNGWVKVGKVTGIYAYPLLSGKKHQLLKSLYTIKGIKSIEFPFNRMFVVYDPNTNIAKNATDNFLLTNVNISMNHNSADSEEMILEAAGMTKLIFSIKGRDSPFQCQLSHNINISVPSYDCGPHVSAWISMYLTGKPDGLCLAYIANNDKYLSILNYKPSKVKKLIKYTQSLNILRDLMGYMLITTSDSLDNFNQLFTHSKMHYRPDICITLQYPIAPDEWDWIRIGRIVIQNFNSKRWRSRMCESKGQRIVKYTDWQLLMLGYNCKLYSEGNMSIDDDVYFYFSK